MINHEIADTCLTNNWSVSKAACMSDCREAQSCQALPAVLEVEKLCNLAHSSHCLPHVLKSLSQLLTYSIFVQLYSL